MKSFAQECPDLQIGQQSAAHYLGSMLGTSPQYRHRNVQISLP